MPLRPLTLVLNSNNSQKATVLLPADVPDAHAWILKEARNKLRIRSLKRVFLRGGAELQPGAALDPDSDASEVWVSKGEEYIGPAPKQGGSVPGEAKDVVRVIAQESYVDPEAVTQLKAVAALPGVRLAAGMPDLHPGNRFPIGCAIVAEGIYPALIGSDVGCGIALYHLAAIPARLDPPKLAAQLRGLDDPWDGDVAVWLARYGIARASEFDRTALGTVGAGNHFAEVCRLEKALDGEACDLLGLDGTHLYLMVHSGSRGLGASILEKQTRTSANPYIPPDSPELPAYVAEHDYAVAWAVANRDLIAHRISRCLFPGDGGDDDQPDSDRLTLRKIVDITHNSVVRVDGTAPVLGDLSQAAPGEERNRDVWIHRKGAAPADRGVAPCPGSRGDFSWLLMPTGDGANNAHSLAHGAGRMYPRAAMHKYKDQKGGKAEREALASTALGSEVVCADPALLVEERPEAYKSCEGVVRDLELAGAARGVAVLRPVVTYKIREGARRKA
ncbi:release factor H-coupled R [Punctularia strigosozonata HHB-11173 SS5]|uniref:release factor H-coupled R n=1 Tax=Punctularia strigosozonata (strain HHB-11173) TaxID=741275 RepID=UPI0004418234|nr:release factor H-coupled R [Punctularia strigosozonata HHB-11173 SS5]EIN09622.1 release factor H-coupled R [Punctularia strigosozonata HHB-11173 SS5]